MSYPSEHTIRRVIGPTILLGSGNYYDFLDPEGSTITIEDFAYGLAFQSRFAGQCVSRKTGKRVYYSIAQHCEIMSYNVDEEDAYAALMHEAGEPVCHDVTAPLKSLIPEYKAIEKRCESANMAHFMVEVHNPDAVKMADLRMWATERRDIMNWLGQRWSADDVIQPFPFLIEPVGPYEAAARFINRFNQLAPQALSRGSKQHG